MRIKLAPVAAALLIGAVVTLSGCAAEPSAPENGTTPAPEESSEFQPEAVWLDQGRLIGVVTWGSSTCIPFAGEATASGQDITVDLSDTLEGQEPRACTADIAPRVTVIGTPAGIDPHEDATVTVNYNEQKLALEVAGEATIEGTPGESTDYLPSAAWMNDKSGIVLLTWGSSTCVPVAESIEKSDTGVIATFAAQTGPCTMDMVPRATILGVSEKVDGQVLTLVGDNLDATVPLIG